MPMSNYPHGFSNGVAIRGVPLLNSYPGEVFWVSNRTGDNGSNGNDGSFTRPFSTIDYAIGRCTASRGDVILVKAGHAETLATASAITADVAGVAIIGLGEGANRPTLTFSATDATMVISAASVTLQNVVVKPSVDSVVSPIVVSGADCYLDYEHQDASAAVEAVRAILTTSGADRLAVKLKYVGFIAGNAVVNAVRLVGVDTADISVDFYGVASTAIVEFHTTACTNVKVRGVHYNSGTTDLSKNVVDTVTGSTWSVAAFDAAAGCSYSGGSAVAVAKDDVSSVVSNQAVPSADATANALERDVVGNKTDAVLTAVGTTKSIAAYIKTVLQNVGFLADAAVYAVGTTTSLMAYVKGLLNTQEKVVSKAAAVMANGDVLFTVAGGPIMVIGLTSICVTPNDATASTLQYSATPTVGSATTISAASASLANAAAGASVTLAGTALSTAALLSATGPNLIANPGTVMVPAGTITAVIGTGSTTGTWVHYLRYRPLATGVTVS